VAPQPAALAVDTRTDQAELTKLFHRLNNQLGVVLANAELLEARLTTESERARAALVVSGALEAIATVRDLRSRVGRSSIPS
jgi:hypothetical protein